MRFLSMSISLLTLVFTSCESDLITSNAQEDLKMAQEIETERFISPINTLYKDCKFLYEGKTYEYTATIVNDSVVNINNDAAKAVLSELENASNTVTYLHLDGTIELFQNQEVFYSKLPQIIKDDEEILNNEIVPYQADVPWETVPPIDKSNNKIANLYLCDDNNFCDTYHQFNLKSGEKVLEVRELKSVGLNDKVTSFAAYTIGGTTFFELYEDSDFKDSCISFTVYQREATAWSGDIIFKWRPPANQYGQLLVADLKDIFVRGHKVDTWNDRISSVRITRK